jgi:hypothetical protein
VWIIPNAGEAIMKAVSVCLLAVVGVFVSTSLAAQSREVQPADLLYQGSFTFANASTTCSAGTVDFAYVQGVIAYNPANRSLFVVGHDHCQHVAEFRVPEIGGVAPLLQPFRDVTGGRLSQINPSDPGSKKIGGLHVLGDRLVMSAYSFYDGGGTATSSHFVRSTNLGAADVRGPFRVGSLNPGFYAGYFAPIPAEWQERFRGTVLNGQCCLSIISRTSFGPSVSVVSPEDLLAARDRTPATMLVGYPEGHLELGDGTATGPLFNLTSQVRGVVLPKGTSSVLFFGHHGLGRYCYGEAAECGDPINLNKGGHAYPYQPQVWAYRASELADVRAGRKQPWDVRPYATWRVPVLRDHRIGGVAVDEDSGRIFVLESYGDGERPKVHVFTIRDQVAGGEMDGGATCSYDLAAGAETLREGDALRMSPGSAQAVVTVAPSDTTCAWTAWSGADWLMVKPETGVGDGQVTITASANPEGYARVGYASVAGWTFTVTQDTASERVPMFTIPRPFPRRPY